MAYYYSNPARADSPTALPDIEVFWHPGWVDDRGAGPDYGPGWYWWACLPGCLPDSDEPNGPFATEAEAVADAQDIRD